MRLLFTSFFLFWSVLSFSQQGTSFIHVDQFGYLPNARKLAVLSDPQVGFNAANSYTPSTVIELRNAADDMVVASYEISEWNNLQTHEASGDRGWWVDFSSYTTPGSYYLFDIENQVASAEFEIGDHVYNELLKTAGRAFFYNRCGAAKPEEFAGEWSDLASFENPGQDTECRYIYDPNNPELARDLSGGWFDAGDYNKYVTFLWACMNDLLMAYRESTIAFGDDWNIPESGNGIPDILDEIKWELDWLMKMNNPDGTCIIKMGSQNYNENTLSPPSANTDPRFYGPTCTSASIASASVLSQAAVVFGQYASFAGYANQLHAQAVANWNYGVEMASQGMLETDCDDGSIVAGDADWSVEQQEQVLVQTAVYLYEFSYQDDYASYFIDTYQSLPAYTWIDSYSMAFSDAMLNMKNLNYSASLTDDLNAALSTMVQNDFENFMGEETTDLYGAHMPDYSYHWGSNSPKASYGNLNWSVAQLLGEAGAQEHQSKAADFLHYFHGVNPLDLVMLSNMYSFGAEHCVNEIYHTWFYNGTDYDNAILDALGPAPGFVTGGPNQWYSGTFSPPANQPIMKSYLDYNDGFPEVSWEITEPAIYYQAAYLRLLAHFVVYDPGNSVEEVDQLEANLYPNPAQRESYFESVENGQLTVLNTKGQVIQQLVKNQSRLVIRLDEPGLYVLHFLADNGLSLTRKLIIE